MRLVDIGVAALTVALLLSMAANGLPEGSAQSFFRVTLTPLCLYWNCRWFLRDAEITRVAFDTLLIGACISGIYASWEWTIGRNPLLETFAPPVGDLANHGYWTATEGNFSGLYRSHGFGMNPIFFGATSAMLLMHAAVRFATAEKPGNRLPRF
jgi:hypothetical protein